MLALPAPASAYFALVYGAFVLHSAYEALAVFSAMYPAWATTDPAPWAATITGTVKALNRSMLPLPSPSDHIAPHNVSHPRPHAGEANASRRSELNITYHRVDALMPNSSHLDGVVYDVNTTWMARHSSSHAHM